MSTANPLSFQDVIMALQRYWADQGCLIWQPYSEKVGAGTGNPATVLRVLGPEPWRVAYVEPSYRPDDGRYAENPNRMQMHTQYQVILKPTPANAQELYLRSLEAIGIDRDQHDIRFVEDNWESPALGAWGLGWEVWLDGLEISQYTYFQQAGGYPLDPVSVEYTYGLERIVMYLQGVKEVWQIDWDGQRTYGDVLKQTEIEHCKYDFEVADVGRLKQLYDLFEAEARNALAHRLVIPAHDYVLRCSHTFNLLDARGAIGVTERAHFFARMRDLARQVSIAYYEQRQQAEFPWLIEDERLKIEDSASLAAVTDLPSSIFNLQSATYLLEIGAEELPPADLAAALEQLRASVPKLLADLRLAHGDIFVSGAPRRLTILVDGLAGRQADEETVVKGPPAERAFDAAGAATPAAAGFARKYGVPVEALEVRSEGGGRYVYAVVRKTGRPTAEVLAEALPGLVAGIKFGKAMRWNATNVAFSRPLRWFVSLLGDRVIPFEYAGLAAGRLTYGPRAEGSPELIVSSADAYLPLMAEHRIIVDRAARRAEVSRQIAQLAAAVDGAIPDDPALLDEVTDLVEQPTALRGGFEADYLRLPKEVLITVMKKHQRYFPVVDAQSKMLPYFIAVRNGGQDHLDVVQAGNEGVLRARYADADYFFRADTARPLEAFTPRLSTLTFQEKLGSMLDKVHRVEQLAPHLGELLGLTAAEQRTTRRAAQLFKSDLATQMVVELTSLQGIMGREYARLSGEEPAVSQAIFEHYLPRSQGDILPQSRPGLVLGIANRLDSLVGLFAVGLAATSTADPFGLRRDALGLVQALAGLDQPLDLRPALAAAAGQMPVPVGEGVLADVLTFVRDRLYGWLRDQGLPHDVVSAVLAVQGHDPARATAAARDLAQLVQAADWPETFTAYARCKRIVRNLPETHALAAEHYAEPATRGLYEAWQAVAPQPESVAALADVLRELKEPINRFFADVLVMAEDPAVRAARLALVQRIAALPDAVADLSQLQGF
ncbi:MAG: Glycine--tRNA ligase beta subunit [Chloroflexi bacterium ADurb.Bin325]|nr:MAG: Glycine--tRNA ligase beta subunit [Chloroflexi bacterium ADurb.Bin325]